jgi:hypothetical protein
MLERCITACDGGELDEAAHWDFSAEKRPGARLRRSRVGNPAIVSSILVTGWAVWERKGDT